jgi:hypothetical protein
MHRDSLKPVFVEGSYKDPSGRVVLWQDRVFRTLSDEALERFSVMDEGGLIQRLTTEHGLWPAALVPESETIAELGRVSPSGRVLEHPKLPFVSHPYEWPFSLLKKAALAHIDLHLAALEEGFSLIDGSAYNVQFIGPKPVFIDTLSLVPYHEGDPWQGYRQFCEHFLCPLILQAKCGVSYHAWYRGELDGISIAETAKLLPWHRKLSLTTMFHIVLHATQICRWNCAFASRRHQVAKTTVAQPFAEPSSRNRAALALEH